MNIRVLEARRDRALKMSDAWYNDNLLAVKASNFAEASKCLKLSTAFLNIGLKISEEISKVNNMKQVTK
mgnify:CR=1 FL=1